MQFEFEQDIAFGVESVVDFRSENAWQSSRLFSARGGEHRALR